jgi:hypothetical protein
MGWPMARDGKFIISILKRWLWFDSLILFLASCPVVRVNFFLKKPIANMLFPASVEKFYPIDDIFILI